MDTRLTLCALLALTSLTAAQSPPRALDAATRAAGVVFEDGRIEAIGPRYRARFGSGFAEYVPALGVAAPQPQTLRTEVAAVRRGHQLCWSTDLAARPEPMVRNGRVEFDHAAGSLVERWTPRANGIELSFVFAEPLRGTGDLVVAISLRTTLPMHDTTWLEDGLRLVTPGIGGVSVGAVTGIDAIGRTAVGSLRIHDGRLELSLPESFVKSAQYPLVLDPLIATEFAVGGTGSDSLAPVAAYDSSSRSWLVLLQSRFAIGVSDVYGFRVDGSGTVLGSPILISGASAGLKQSPAVGSVEQNGMFLVAWQESEFVGASADIRARVVRSSDGALGGVFSVASTVDDETHPDIACSSSSDRTVVVWGQRGASNGVFARRIIMPGTLGTPLPGPVVTIGSSIVEPSPAISQNGGSVNRFAIVWCADANDIHARLVDVSAGVLGGLTIVQTAGNLTARPDVDGDGTDFLVVYERRESSSTESDVVGRKLHFDGTNLVTASSVLPIDAQPGDDDREPAVAFLGPKYAVLWSSEGVGLDRDLEGVLLRTDDCTSCGVGFTPTSLSRPRQSSPQLASRRASGESSDECLLLWAEADLAPPFQSNVIAQRFEAHGGQLPVVISPGCAGGGDSLAIGDFVFGNAAFYFQVKRADPGTFAFAFFLGLPGPGFSCGTCEVMSPLVQVLVPPTIGPAGASATFYHQPSCDPRFLGLQLDFQWIAVGTSTAPCPLVPGVAVSDRVRVTLAP